MDWRPGTLALLLVSCAALGKLCYFSVLPFFRLENGDRNDVYLPQWLHNERTCAKQVEQCIIMTALFSSPISKYMMTSAKLVQLHHRTPKWKKPIGTQAVRLRILLNVLCALQLLPEGGFYFSKLQHCHNLLSRTTHKVLHGQMPPDRMLRTPFLPFSLHKTDFVVTTLILHCSGRSSVKN